MNASSLQSYLTPFKCVQQIKRERFRKIPINRFDVFGCVYDNNYFLKPESLRMLGGKWRHKDPASLHDHEAINAVELDGFHRYLGHAFPTYGHFILETLPMLSYLIEDHDATGVFLAWGASFCRSLLDTIVALLELNKSSILIHSTPHILKTQLAVQPRPLRLAPCSPSPRYELINDWTYRTVIDKLIRSAQASPGEQATEPQSRLFLMRSAKRLPGNHFQDSLKIELEAQGFRCLYPETLSFPDQVRSLSTASVVAGFAGSQLHNSIFCPRESIIIGIGDQRTPDYPLIFQGLCGDIAKNTYHHINYTENPGKIASDISDLLAR
jgi:capsular polysaccharide biosynthesis protein